MNLLPFTRQTRRFGLSCRRQTQDVVIATEGKYAMQKPKSKAFFMLG
jgi:hypothetical protein